MATRSSSRGGLSVVAVAGASGRVRRMVEALHPANRQGSSIELAAEGADPADIVRLLGDRAGGASGKIVVLEALGGGPATGPLFDDMAEAVLGTSPCPVLVLGPAARVPTGRPMDLFVLADGTSALGALRHAVTDFVSTVGEVRVVVAELAAPDPWADSSGDEPGQGPIGSFARAVGAREQVLFTDGDPHVALRRAARHVPGAILVVAARRWPDAGEHWYRHARRLIRTASVPVLVVPDDLGDADRSGSPE